MRRRSFAIGFGGAMAWPLLCRAQAVRQVRRVGILRPTAPDENDGIRSALHELGYVEGQNLIVDQRFANGEFSLLPALARELVKLQPDVLVAVGAAAIRAIRDASASVPVVMFGNFDPVSAGLVASLARPGGNMTGILISPEGTLGSKRLELLREAVPRAERIAMLVPDDANARPQVLEVQKAAEQVGVELIVVEVRGSDYDRAFAAIKAADSGALFVAGHTNFFRDRKAIVALAAQYRLPATYEWPEQARDGGLMAYGPDRVALYRRIGSYIDRILKGARAGDLPIEQPTKFEFVINVGTARALDLAIPPLILSRADELIE
jgi:putative ABC transport system substrate-binding protein